MKSRARGDARGSSERSKQLFYPFEDSHENSNTVESETVESS